MLTTILRLAASETDISAHLFTLYALARLCSSVSVPIVELGVRMGNSTLAILLACAETCGRLVSYDLDYLCPSNVRFTASTTMRYPWNGYWDPVINMHWDFRCKDSIEAASDWPGGELASPTPVNPCVGMLLIDTLHDYDHARGELQAWLPKLRRDAVITGHDYLLDGAGVRRAVDEFVAANESRFEKIILPYDYGLFVLMPH